MKHPLRTPIFDMKHQVCSVSHFFFPKKYYKFKKFEKMTLVERWKGAFLSHPYLHNSCSEPETTRGIKTRKEVSFYIPLSLFSFNITLRNIIVIYRWLRALQHFLLWLKVHDGWLASPGVILVLPSRVHT